MPAAEDLVRICELYDACAGFPIAVRNAANQVGAIRTPRAAPVMRPALPA